MDGVWLIGRSIGQETEKVLYIERAHVYTGGRFEIVQEGTDVNKLSGPQGLVAV